MCVAAIVCKCMHSMHVEYSSCCDLPLQAALTSFQGLAGLSQLGKVANCFGRALSCRCSAGYPWWRGQGLCYGLRRSWASQPGCRTGWSRSTGAWSTWTSPESSCSSMGTAGAVLSSSTTSLAPVTKVGISCACPGTCSMHWQSHRVQRPALFMEYWLYIYNAYFVLDWAIAYILLCPREVQDTLMCSSPRVS